MVYVTKYTLRDMNLQGIYMCFFWLLYSSSYKWREFPIDTFLILSLSRDPHAVSFIYTFHLSPMFSFTKNRFRFYTFALVISTISLLAPLLLWVNLGIDMTGGIQIEYNSTNWKAVIWQQNAKTAASTLKKEILYNEKEIINDITIYGVAGTDSFVVEAGFSIPVGSKVTEIEELKANFVKKLTTTLTSDTSLGISQSRYVNIGESFGDYIKKSAYITLTLAIIAISLYIQYAFRGSIQGIASWPFALVTGVSLIHDVLVAFGLYVITSFYFPQFKIDTFLLTALLTILGYSINDTIVVMDRIRSTLRDGIHKKLSFSQMIDTAIHDTMRRSLFTSLTIFIVVLAMFLFGPESLKGFTLALLFGTIVGTYSSICIASPLLIDITGKK